MLIFLIRHGRVKNWNQRRRAGEATSTQLVIWPAFVRERKPAEATARIVHGRSIVGVLTVEQGQPDPAKPPLRRWLVRPIRRRCSGVPHECAYSEKRPGIKKKPSVKGFI